MKKVGIGFVLLLGVCVLTLPGIQKSAFAQAVSLVSVTTADHSKFKVLQQEFKSASDVTEACLTCHTEASKQVQKTIHWTWEYDKEKMLGKRYVLNNF